MQKRASASVTVLHNVQKACFALSDTDVQNGRDNDTLSIVVLGRTKPFLNSSH